MIKITAILQSLPVFQGIRKETMQDLEAHATIHSFCAKKVIIEERKPCDYLYIVLQGRVSVYKMNANGQKKVIFILGKGELVNEDMVEGLPSAVSVELFEAGSLIMIPKCCMLRLMAQDPRLAAHMYTSLSMKARRMVRQLKNTPNSIKMEKRLAAKLFKLGKDYGRPHAYGTEIAMDLSITYLADLLGSQRETISRAVKALQAEGLVLLDKKRFYIPDMRNLSNYFKAP